MRKLVVTALLTSAVLAQASANISPQEIATLAANAVVFISTHNADGKYYQGTGFLCDYKGNGDMLIVTNAHVMEGAIGVKIENQQGQALEFTSYCGYDTDADLAILNFKWGDVTNKAQAGLALADYQPSI